MNDVLRAINNIFSDDFELVLSGLSSGEYNMEYDLERTNQVAKGLSQPIFRLYGWKPWAVSLGANQKILDIDKKKCEEYGWSVVYRPTGGRAVLHANEITYAVVTKLAPGQTSHSIYRDIHIILLEAFKSIGCKELEFHKAQPNFRDLYKNEDVSVSCFASTARYEISYKGRKVIGSAQRLFGDTLLQHGSIPLDSGYELIAEVINNSNDTKKNILREYLLSHSATISESAGRKITYDEALNAIFNIIVKSNFDLNSKSDFSKKNVILN